jgi:hypothetical protein
MSALPLPGARKRQLRFLSVLFFRVLFFDCHERVSLLISNMSKSAPADKTLEYLGVVERWSMRLKTGNLAVGQIADLGPQITQPRLLLQLQLHTVAVLAA